MSARSSLYELIREVVAQKESEWDDEGGAWLAHPDPDTSYLRVESLADAITDAVLRETPQ